MNEFSADEEEKRLVIYRWVSPPLAIFRYLRVEWLVIKRE